jgi:hypothetical protein
MKIEYIKISGFKNISDIELSLTNFNSLVALNNYGKSNVIEAIEFAHAFISSNNSGKSQMMQSSRRIPINNLIAGKDFFFEICFHALYENINYDIVYAYSFEWKKNQSEGKRIKSEILKVRKIEKDSKYSTYINRLDDKKTYIKNKTGRCDNDILIEDNNLIINKLSNYDDIFYLDIVKEINSLKFLFFSLVDVEQRFNTGFEIKQNGDENEEMSEIPSIANFFFNLKSTNKNKYDLLVNSIIDLLPDIEYINPIEIDFKKESQPLKKTFVSFEFPEKIYDIRVKVKTNNQETSVKNLSCGSKRIFYILASLIIAELNKIQLLTFEELENSIHPALLQKLLMIISELANNTQILITSHSPHLIKYLNLNDIYIGIPNIEGLADFKRIKRTKQQKISKCAKDAETNIGDYIFDMLIEGYNDDSIWPEYI